MTMSVFICVVWRPMVAEDGTCIYLQVDLQLRVCQGKLKRVRDIRRHIYFLSIQPTTTKRPQRLYRYKYNVYTVKQLECSNSQCTFPNEHMSHHQHHCSTHLCNRLHGRWRPLWQAAHSVLARRRWPPCRREQTTQSFTVPMKRVTKWTWWL